MRSTENIFNKAEAPSSSKFVNASSSSPTHRHSCFLTRSKTSLFVKLLILVSIVMVCYCTLDLDLLLRMKNDGLVDAKKYQKPPKDGPNATTSLHPINQTITTAKKVIRSAAAPSTEVKPLPNDNNTPIPIDISIPKKTPTNTINIGDFPKSVTGGATLEMFKGRWIPRRASSSSPTNVNPTCPLLATMSTKFACNYTTSLRERRYKKYAAPSPYDWDPFDASSLVERTKERGPIMIVGDSVSGQMKDSLLCLLESQLGWRDDSFESVVLFSSTAIPMSRESMEDVEVTPGARSLDEFERMVDLSWAETAIEKNVSYVVFNTGPWWNNDVNFRVRGDWCDYGSWRYVSGEEMVMIYERSFRRTIIPILQRLRAEHGIIAIWRDVSSAGLWNKRQKTIGTRSKNSKYYRLFPVFNRIGRRLVTELADGLMLPIFDLSLDRWDDHVLNDASYTSTDPMHWCINYNEDDVPAVWNRLLYQVLFGNANRDGNTADATDSGESLTAIIMKGGPQQQQQQLNTTANNNKDGMDKPFTIKNSESVLPKDQKNEVDNLSPVPYSRSNTSECQCSSARTFYHCVANIACEWVEIKPYAHCSLKIDLI